jgi:hypothetical protein
MLRFATKTALSTLSMKLTLITPALVAVLGLALAGTSTYAQTSTNAVSTASTSSSTTTSTVTAKKTPYKGTLTAINTTANTITVQGAKATITLSITPTTKYKGGAALSDFAVGDAVTGSYTKDDSGVMTAFSLHKKTAAK